MFWLRKVIVKSPIYLNEKEQEDNFNYIMKILVYFKNIAIEKDSIPIVVIMGNSNSFNDRNSILKPWKEFKDGLSDIGIKYIDTSDSLYYHYKKNPSLVINDFGTHYTHFSNDIVAEIINQNIE